jgi:hypothetical protein
MIADDPGSGDISRDLVIATVAIVVIAWLRGRPGQPLTASIGTGAAVASWTTWTTDPPIIRFRR